METHSPGSGHILLVDDEPSLLKMMSVYLRRLGYSVTTSHSTEQAAVLAKADPQAFAVAVMDATMGGLGMEALALQMLQGNASLRVLVSSGYPVDMKTLETAASGRVAFLHKPFTPEMLAAAVRRMLAPEKEEGV